ncbi:hypothetical protein Nepgr_019600 [Nepenthes gracilis]|uniref:Uncharacterized protein n=1 Tax=Nepenthes gracilis TaxID=150966 RepID=A0AAD3XV74_NEPGR|nr:hypothetical protein Nepgr_019600 [Nepenthes gracilis]
MAETIRHSQVTMECSYPGLLSECNSCLLSCSQPKQSHSSVGIKSNVLQQQQEGFPCSHLKLPLLHSSSQNFQPQPSTRGNTVTAA